MENGLGKLNREVQDWRLAVKIFCLDLDHDFIITN